MQKNNIRIFRLKAQITESTDTVIDVLHQILLRFIISNLSLKTKLPLKIKLIHSTKSTTTVPCPPTIFVKYLIPAFSSSIFINILK